MDDGAGVLGRADEPARYQVLFDRLPDAVYEVDRDGRIVAGNAALAALTGGGAGSLIGVPCTAVIHPADVVRVRREFERVLAGEVRSYETRIVHRDGSVSVMQITNLPVVVDGEVDSVYGIARDVTELGRTQRPATDGRRGPARRHPRDRPRHLPEGHRVHAGGAVGAAHRHGRQHPDPAGAAQPRRQRA